MSEFKMDDDLESDGSYGSENETLNNVYKKQQKQRNVNYDSDDEVMGFSASEDENEDDDDNDDYDSLDSDIEGLNAEQDLPNDKAWGNKKQQYYSTDYVDADYSTIGQKEAYVAEAEEQEAKNLQKRLHAQLDEHDFGLDLIAPKTGETTNDGQVYFKTDLDKLSIRQKKEYFKAESPEFEPLISDFVGNNFIICLLLKFFL